MNSKSLKIWHEVRRILDQRRSVVKNNVLIAPHLRELNMDSSLSLLWEEIQNLDEVIYQAVVNSLNEHEIDNRPNVFSTEEEKERSLNNQVNWEATFVIHYGILLATNKDIEKLDSIVNNIDKKEQNKTVFDLVHAIELIHEYNLLWDKKEALKMPKEVEEQKKIIESKEEEIEFLRLKEIGFRKLIEKLDKQSISNIEQEAGTIDFTAKEYALAYLFDLDVQGKNVPIRITDAAFDKEEIKKQAIKRKYPKKADTFYRAVYHINKDYDRNDPKQLNNISKRWKEAIRELTLDWLKLEEYLELKNL